MEISGNRWFSELGVDESSLIYGCDMSFINQFTPHQVASAPGGGFQQNFSPDSYTSCPSFQPVVTAPQTSCTQRPRKMQKINSWNSRTAERNSTLPPDSSSPDSLLFCNPNSPNDVLGRAVASPGEMRAIVSHGSAQKHETLAHQGTRIMTKTGLMPSQAQEHIMAERKRREKLSQRFIALSASIPGLKKKDKASVLGDAVKYVKELEERVKTLEDKNARRTVESVVLVKKSKLSVDSDASSSSEISNGSPAEKPLPEIEAMLSEKTVLMRIHCENHTGVLVRLLSEIEKVHLTVINASVMPFPSSSINITVTAKVEEEFSMAVGDLVRKLNSALS